MPVPLYQAKAEFLRTLGHPARIRILELLSERDHAVHELLEQIAIEPSNLSQQLAVLRRTALVVSQRKDGEVPIDGVLLRLGRVYVDAGKKSDAEQTFNRLVEEFPDSPFSADARRELDQLKKT